MKLFIWFNSPCFCHCYSDDDDVDGVVVVIVGQCWMELCAGERARELGSQPYNRVLDGDSHKVD